MNPTSISHRFFEPHMALLCPRPHGSMIVIPRSRSPRAQDFWWNFQLIVAAAIGLVVYASTDTDFVLYRLGLQRLEPAPQPRAMIDAESILNHLGLRWSHKQTEVDATSEPEEERNSSVGRKGPETNANKSLRQSAPDIPVPTEYGAYAVVNGQLTELERMPIKIPDPRVAISASISMPSRTHLPLTSALDLSFFGVILAPARRIALPSGSSRK